jgi:hypothetical protein
LNEGLLWGDVARGRKIAPGRITWPGGMMTNFFGFPWSDGFFGASAPAAPAAGLRVMAVELPAFVTPTVAGLTVGAVVGVVGFVLVMLLVDRPARVRAARGAGRPGALVPSPGSARRAPATAFEAHPRGFGPQGAFSPSTELSARAFARMSQPDFEPPTRADSPDAGPSLFFRELEGDEGDLIPTTLQASPILVEPARPRSEASGPHEARTAEKSAPHPLGIIKSTSPAMRAAPIADLAFDDGPTEIGETYFDEPPQPRRRSDPPKIRAVRPVGPRSVEEATPLLPQLSPPPARVSPRSG